MAVRIVVLADTHMPRRGRELPAALLAALADADMIVYLGDFTETSVIETLASFAPLHAVYGNNDSWEVRAQLPAVKRLTVSGRTLHLMHGDAGGPTALTAARGVRDADAVLFGHSHRAWSSQDDGRLLFNPGSPTDRRWLPHRTFGILTVGETIEPRIVLI